MRLLRWAWRVLIAVLIATRVKKRRAQPPPEPDPTTVEPQRNPGAETAAALLLGATALFAAGFVVLYAAHPDTQLLGITIGGAFACLAGALILAGKRIVVQEQSVEPRSRLLHEQDVEEVDALVKRGAEGITRRRLLRTSAAAAGLTLGGALVVPAASLGPKVGSKIENTPWQRGRRLVDTKGQPYRPGDIEIGSMYTALAEGADQDSLGSPLVVVKLTPDENNLPPERRSWAPQDIVAYSKICPHAGCAISLYRYPLYKPTSPGPGLVCPCHYSTFDPGSAGKLLFGPAGRALPQLPLEIGADGYLAAAGDFPDEAGPSWWKVRRQHGGAQ